MDELNVLAYISPCTVLTVVSLIILSVLIFNVIRKSIKLGRIQKRMSDIVGITCAPECTMEMK